MIALTIQATGVPYTFTLLAFNLGVPAAMLWFSKWVLDAKDERLEMQRWEIEAEEWGRAVRAGDHIVKPK